MKKWGLDTEFTVLGGTRLGCITCMKYGAWCEQEGADARKKKKTKKKVKQVKKVKKKSHGPAEADRGEETTHADIQNTFQKGTSQGHQTALQPGPSILRQRGERRRNATQKVTFGQVQTLEVASYKHEGKELWIQGTV